jgi:hypothetical protein
MKERAFEIRRVIPPKAVRGRMRLAQADETATIRAWIMAFIEEARLNDPYPSEAKVRERIEKGEIFLWIDGVPISMAATARPIGKGISIGMVYTPPEHRRHGYASALVASLSQRLLDGGFEYCTLFTDQANPTSNAIYQRIGYRPVCDYDLYRFGQQ